MNIKICVGFIFVIAIAGMTLGCHPVETSITDDKDDEDKNTSEQYEYEDESYKLRKKRQASLNTISSQEFFVKCLSFYLPQTDLDLETVVRFTINETIWFHKTDQEFCRFSDSAACWKSKLYTFLRPTSEFLSPGLSCIEKYSEYRRSKHYGLIVRVNSTSFKRRYRRKVLTMKLPLDMDEFERKLRNVLPPQSMIDARTLIKFCETETKCSPEICSCHDIKLPKHEKCGQYWYTKIGALTRLDVRIRKAIVGVINSAISNALTRGETGLLTKQVLSSTRHAAQSTVMEGTTPPKSTDYTRTEMIQ